MFLFYSLILNLVLIVIISAICYYFFQESSDVSARSQETTENDEDEDSSSDEFDNITEEDKISVFLKYVGKEKLYEMIETDQALNGTFRYIEENLTKWKRQKVNIAVAGNSGVGKSSLINALRGMKPTDIGGAKVGVTETTFEPKSYTYPNNRNAVLWDLPGMGTVKFPKMHYLEKMDYEEKDVFIIVCSNRVTEDDIRLAKELLSRGKHVLFTRNQIDLDLQKVAYDQSSKVDEIYTLSNIKGEIVTKLESEGLHLNNNIFLVSAVKPALYDFQDFQWQLKSILNKRGITISHLIYELVSENMEQYTMDLCQNNFGVRKSVAHALGFLPETVNAGICYVLFGDIHKKCLQRYGLHKESLNKIEAEHKYIMDNVKTQRKLLKLYPQGYKVDKTTCFLMFGSLFPMNMWEFFRNRHTFKMKLPDMCKEMEKCVLHLIKLRLNKLQDELDPLSQTITD